MNKIDLLISIVYEKFFKKEIKNSINVINEKLINEREFLLSYNLPLDYRYYLFNYNWISMPGNEVYYIVNTVPIKWPDILRHYEWEHKEAWNPMPEYLVPFSPDWFWNHYCFNKKDNKIYFWDHEMEEWDKNPEYICDSFTQRLEKQIRQVAEWDWIELWEIE